MSVTRHIDRVLWYLTKRGADRPDKKISLNDQTDRCEYGGGEIVQVRKDGTRACWKCGKQAPSK